MLFPVVSKPACNQPGHRGQGGLADGTNFNATLQPEVRKLACNQPET